MPIWFELLILLLVTYAVGLGIGWTIWGGSDAAIPVITPTADDIETKDR